MRIAGILFAVVVSATCAEASASKPEVRGEISSRDAVRATLRERGISLGFDADRGRIVAIGTRGFSLKGDGKDDELESTEIYDFPDDANDDFETKRFKAVWKAYADGLADIATLVGSSMDDTETKDKDGKVASRTTKMAASLSLDGVATIEMCESLTADGEYEVAVAVCQSNKRREMYSRGVAGGAARPGKHTIAEFVEQKSNSGSGMICPQSYCDNAAVWWRVAGVPVDLSAGRDSKRVAVLTEKAKRYAYEAALRTIAVGVSASTSVSSCCTNIGDDYKIQQKLSRTVTMAPMNTVLPVDSSQVKWFEFDKVNMFTGKPVRCVVAALRSGSSRAR